MLPIARLNGRIGALVSGVRLAADFLQATIAAIRQAMVAHKVIFFRDQSHLEVGEQETFARRFGPLQGHPFITRHAAGLSGSHTLRIDSAADVRTSTMTSSKSG